VAVPIKTLHKQISTRISALQQQLFGQLPDGLKAVTVVSLAVTGITIGIKQLGGFESPELRIHDAMVRFLPNQKLDERLLVVAITEADIRALNRANPSDATLAKAIANLNQHQPRVMGLDLYRDVPQQPGAAQLKQQLETTPTIGITKLGNTSGDRIPPPPGVTPERIGFNDIPVDRDGVIRRNLMIAGGDYISFSLNLALTYLEAQGIPSKPSPQNENHMQIGQAIFLPLQPDSGGYQTVDTSGYQILLKYRSRKVARQVTLSQVLEDKVDSTWIKDKIILIGYTAISSNDLLYTPYSAGEQEEHKMPGVMIHAQMVSQILDAATGDRPLPWFISAELEYLWITTWIVIGGAIAWRLKHPISLSIGLMAMLMLLTGTGLLLFTASGWLPMVAPAVGYILSMGTVVAYRGYQSQKQQQMVMTLLGQNTSKEIADALWQNRDRLIASGKLPGQRLTATILFTDLQGFSTVSEQLTPEALLEWLNEYLEVMTDLIQQQQGVVNKFTGDGLLAVFGVPIPRTDAGAIATDANHAITCALKMAERLKDLNQQWQQRGLAEVKMRVGIFTGDIVVGSLGGRQRMEYGVIGDSVNIASRLESCAKERQADDCRILIAQETLDYVQGKFQVEAWGPMELKGKRQLVEVYRVTGAATHL
jgi:adenylate cyclase